MPASFPARADSNMSCAKHSPSGYMHLHLVSVLGAASSDAASVWTDCKSSVCKSSYLHRDKMLWALTDFSRLSHALKFGCKLSTRLVLASGFRPSCDAWSLVTLVEKAGLLGSSRVTLIQGYSSGLSTDDFVCSMGVRMDTTRSTNRPFCPPALDLIPSLVTRWLHLFQLWSLALHGYLPE